jgi:glycogen(starch) synthase
MKVFMLGWEFPPFISGGLGTACYGLTKAMDKLAIQITFVLPKGTVAQQSGHVKMLSTKAFHGSEKLSGFKNVKFCTITSGLQPYASSSGPEPIVTHSHTSEATKGFHGQLDPGTGSMHIDDYGGDMYWEVRRYAEQATRMAAREEFDIIHAHDWMTYPAGIAVAKLSGKPLVVQVHSTEFDRSGEHVNQTIYGIEQQGMNAAAKVIAVSNYTRNIIISRYGVPPEKVEVVYNGVDVDRWPHNTSSHAPPKKTNKIVLFLGRITMQKGPEYFLAAAKKVLEKTEDVSFVMAGDGDMLYRAIELAAKLGIGHKVLFTRFLHGNEVDKIYQMADLYVMPSVSEPFGIAALEALQHSVPVLISRRSGVAEVLAHALKVDFWDVNQIANKIVAVLKHPCLAGVLRRNGHLETLKFRWEDSALRLHKIYEQTLALTA